MLVFWGLGPAQGGVLGLLDRGPLLTLVTHIAFAAPFAILPVAAAFKKLDRSLVEAAKSLGASPMATVRTVILPAVGPGVAAGAMLAFIRSLGETGATLIVCGPAYTAPVQIIGWIMAGTRGMFAAAAFLAALLTAISLMALFLVTKRLGRMERGFYLRFSTISLLPISALAFWQDLTLLAFALILLAAFHHKGFKCLAISAGFVVAVLVASLLSAGASALGIVVACLAALGASLLLINAICPHVTARFEARLITPRHVPMLGRALVGVGVLVGLLVLALAFYVTWFAVQNLGFIWQEVFGHGFWPDIVSAIMSSFQIALLATLINVPITFAVAYAIVRRKVVGAEAMRTVATIPLVVPSAALGFSTALFWSAHGLRLVPYGMPTVLLTHVAFTFPILLKPMIAILERVDGAYEEAAKTLGAARWTLARTVVLPLALPGLLAGALLSFALSLGETGATMAAGGTLFQPCQLG